MSSQNMISHPETGLWRKEDGTIGGRCRILSRGHHPTSSADPASPFQPELANALVALLEQHGAQVQRVHPFWIIGCPESTQRSEIFPRTLEERHHLRFPDGYTVLETLTRDGLSRLSVDPQDLPEAVRVAQADVIHVLMGREPPGRADQDQRNEQPDFSRTYSQKEAQG